MSSTYEVLGEDRLDFTKLITYLSEHKSFPCSLHIRNHLLAVYAAHVPCPRLAGRSLDDSPWHTYQEYRPGAQIAAIGHVPKAVRNDGGGQTDGQQEGLWALVLVFPVYAPGWVPRDVDGEEPVNLYTNTCFTMWMNSETKFSDSREAMRNADEEELRLLRFIKEDILPTSVTQVERQARGSVSGDAVATNIFAVNDIWVRALQALAKEDSSPAFTVTRTNPCRTFVLPDPLAFEMQRQEISNRWKAGSIEESDIDLVQSSNSLSFPLWYVRHHIHRSVLLRDGCGESVAEAKVAYPTMQSRDAPAGWAYSHDNMSIGSLHVAEPYRRLHDDEHGSVGQACVRILARRLIEIQTKALSIAGCDPNLPRPILADTELTKGPALSFFLKNGFEPVSISTWGEVRIKACTYKHIER